MKVLYVASEAVPFAKTGGLADVAGSLPKALKAEGVDVRVIMPKFGKIPEKFRDAMEHVYDGEIPVAWRSKFVGLDKLEHDGVTYYLSTTKSTSSARASTAMTMMQSASRSSAAPS